MAEKQEFKLPENFSVVIPKNPSDLVIVGIPKIGKSVLMGDFSKKYNAVILNLEKEAYAYIEGKIINIHISNETTTIEAYENYIKYRNLLLDNIQATLELFLLAFKTFQFTSVFIGLLSQPFYFTCKSRYRICGYNLILLGFFPFPIKSLVFFFNIFQLTFK